MTAVYQAVCQLRMAMFKPNAQKALTSQLANLLGGLSCAIFKDVQQRRTLAI